MPVRTWNLTYCLSDRDGTSDKVTLSFETSSYFVIIYQLPSSSAQLSPNCQIQSIEDDPYYDTLLYASGPQIKFITQNCPSRHSAIQFSRRPHQQKATCHVGPRGDFVGAFNLVTPASPTLSSTATQCPGTRSCPLTDGHNLGYCSNYHHHCDEYTTRGRHYASPSAQQSNIIIDNYYKHSLSAYEYTVVVTGVKLTEFQPTF